MNIKFYENMKKWALCFFLLLFTTLSYGKPLSPKEVKESAYEFMLSKGFFTGRMTKSVQRTIKNGLKPKTISGCYVVNAPNRNGFVVVAGDDRLPRILGYSNESTLDTQHLSKEMSSFLQAYTDQIKVIEKHSLKSDIRSKSIVEKSKVAILPFLKIHWDQDAPYNDKAPIYNVEGKRSATGCVATAMAQVLGHYKYPKETLEDINDYVSRYYHLSVKGVKKGTKIDWHNILPDYQNVSANQEQKEAIANLMYYCGAAVNMDYGPSSGAFTKDAASALKNIFGYGHAKNINRGDFLYSQWEDIIYDELKVKHPVIYGGSSTNGGHAFVCDGFDGNGYYHINWGWGGSSDGYFLLSVLNPYNNSAIGSSSSKDGYTMSQDIIIGIYPEDNKEASELTVPIIGFSGDEISYKVENKTKNDIDLGTKEIDLVVEDESGKKRMIEKIWERSYILKPRSYIFDLKYTIPTDKVKHLGDGKYKLYLISRNKNEENWVKTFNNTYIIIKVEHNKVTDSYWVGNRQNIDLTKLEVDVLGGSPLSELKNHTFNYKVKFKNTGEEFYQNIKLSICKEGETDSVFMALSLRKGESKILEFPVELKTIGDYRATLSVVKHNAPDEILKDNLLIHIDDSDIDRSTKEQYNWQSTQYGDVIYGEFTVENTSDKKGLKKYKVNYFRHLGDGTFKYIDSKSFEVILNPHEKKIIPISCNTSMLGDYIVQIKDITLSLQGDYLGQSYLQLLPGISYWTKNGNKVNKEKSNNFEVPEEAIAVELSGLSSLDNVRPNSSRSTLYYVNENVNVPTSFEGKNVIKGHHATKITLKDNEPFYIIKPINVDEISYERSFNIGSNGKGGWEGIVLPFVPQKIVRTDTEAEIDWFKSRKDRKQFWLKEFVGLNESNEAIFDYVQKFQPFMPYIIAVPGNRWGEKYNLEGKSIRFSAQNVKLSVTPSATYTHLYSYCGDFCSKELPSKSYILNSQGTAFERGLSSSYQPFHTALLFHGEDEELPAYIPIFNNVITDIPSVSMQNTLYMVYNLSGQIVGTTRLYKGQYDLSKYPNGIYIINGKKVIK